MKEYGYVRVSSLDQNEDCLLYTSLVGTGLRVGELTGLRWCDVDLENGVIDVNHKKSKLPSL